MLMIPAGTLSGRSNRRPDRGDQAFSAIHTLLTASSSGRRDLYLATRTGAAGLVKECEPAYRASAAAPASSRWSGGAKLLRSADDLIQLRENGYLLIELQLEEPVMPVNTTRRSN